jgi:hypothetical protein
MFIFFSRLDLFSEMSNPNAVINYEGGDTFSSGSVKCKDINDNIYGVAKPSVCGSVVSQTFSDENPCGCHKNGAICEATYSSNDKCNICIDGKHVGDPSRIIGDSGFFPGLSCEQLEMMASIAFDANSCPKVQADASQFCKCTSRSSIRQCVPADVDADQSQCTSESTCCDGVCQFRGDSLGLICSNRFTLDKDRWPKWALKEVPYPKNDEYGAVSGKPAQSSGLRAILTASGVLTLSIFLIL